MRPDEAPSTTVEKPPEVKRRHAVAVYVLAHLDNVNEKGWRESNSSDPDHGSLVLTRGRGERIEFSHRFNGGDPQWFLFASPRRLREGLEELYPIRSPRLGGDR